MGSLKHKCQNVAGGHMTDLLALITYVRVVSCKSVHITFVIMALNDLNIMAADIKNTYLNSPCDEKIWTHLGPEFSPELEGKQVLIVHSLYGLKSAGAAYCYHLVICMEHLGFTPWLHKLSSRPRCVVM